jgi:hypothetical protein
MTPLYRQIRLILIICLVAAWPTLLNADDLKSAKAEAGKILHAVILALPNGTFVTYYPNGNGSVRTPNYVSFHSFKWNVYTVTLTPAQRLNGWTWNGTIGTTVDAFRSATDTASSHCWQPWEDKPSQDYFILTRHNGVWKTEPPPFLEGSKAPTLQDAERVLKFPKCAPTP